MNLPSQFLQRMKAMLGEEFAAFEESFHRERYSGLRANLLKTSVDKFQRIQPFSLTSIPWCESGFYYDGPAELEKGLRPGKHPWHEAGLYYIQEPSAMAVAEAAGRAIRRHLEEREEEPLRVLDLCAAPGGKSSQLASLLGGRGFLISNEIVPGRAKILSQNMERMGLTNGIVVNHAPEELSARFSGCFDVIVVDAPCSGEGMFRKDEDTIDQWSPENVTMCGERQKDILTDAFEMLAPGGTLVYSTCTFAPEENEAVVLWVLRNYPDVEVLPADPQQLFAEGRPDWIAEDFGCETVDLTEQEKEAIGCSARLWPQSIHGEGHFMAVFQKAGEPEEDEERERTWIGGAKPPKKGKKMKGAHKGYGNQILKKAPPEWKIFAEDFFGEEEADAAWRGALDRICGEGQQFLLFGEQLYAVHADCPDLSGLTVMRAGLHLGTIKKERFEPSHALALALTPAMLEDLSLEERCLEVATEAMAVRYLKGEALETSGAAEAAERLPQDGWNLVTYGGYPLGWTKISGGSAKNHYPKGLRWV
ncbi:MAG: RsmB/NOP family class I SAM-dependent RNA methyltransferase [Firmicutes bacterium]|nr:RsmB/NOP family class I SAM-dependent RNA methyltransferase [Bacillota bacterium]